MGWFRSPENRPSVRSLVKQWEERYTFARAMDLARIGLAVIPMLYVGDLLVLAQEHYADFMLPRLGVVAVGLLNYILLEAVKRAHSLSAQSKRRIGMLSLLVTPMTVVSCYAYFLLLPFPQYRWAIVIAHVLISIFCTLALHRFWREQYIFCVVIFVLYGVLAIVLPESSIEMTSLMLVVWVSAVTSFVYRREFFGFMYLRYENLCTFLPRPIACLAAMAHDRDTITDAFIAEQRFAVILCADWRDFQGLIKTHDPQFISRAFEIFYDLVLEHLDIVFPEGGYVVDWNADELIVIFIGEPGGEEITTRRALVFAYELSTRLFEQARTRCFFDIMYDIGIASGYGLIGLMGPRRRKKTTVASTAAGIAKRLENEAKLARKRTKSTNPYPILALTPELKKSATAIYGFEFATFTAFTATSKDIESQTCFMWQFNNTNSIKRAM